MARKKLSNSKKRSNGIRVRLTNAEKSVLRRKAKPLRLSTWTRAKLLDAAV